MQTLFYCLFLGLLSQVLSECGTEKGLLGACLLVSGNFNINNCTTCVMDNLPALDDGGRRFLAGGGNTTDAPEEGNAVGGDCSTINSLLCDTVDACSERCGGNFCSGRFKGLLVCEAGQYISDCNVTADTCTEPEAAASAGVTMSGTQYAVAMGIMMATALLTVSTLI